MSTDKSTALTTTHATRHDGWTVARQSLFLRELAASHSVKSSNASAMLAPKP